ncbi:DUF222 domain-containing protein [Mycobacterium leprae]|uniref:DUF222 domain-containing protein n=1 Tax=Mycobacterium leprae TaxID=1769 RepID=UPI0002EB5557|nr:DUF222 domain-containing protein [Mycobacterium leprae]OAR19593.1 hypothetical protein A8144_14055 [Mycobacterium leprae 3125609]OAX70092.1 hypothetical protein A3216_14085 [Mycobacterium leprae 7935681]
MGGILPTALASRLHITGDGANRRVAEAADLGERHTLTGQPLPPLLTATATAQSDKCIDTDHMQVISNFFCRPPSSVDIETH